jgi:hypothetical protein
MQVTNEEVDFSIPNMHSRDEEARAGRILRELPGVTGVRLVQRGAWVSYHPQSISHHRICDALRNGGFRASTFQDSATGETHNATI